MFSGIENYKLQVKFSGCNESHGRVATMAVLGLYEPFTHERTFVVWCVSGDSVALLSPLWGRYCNGHSVPCHEVLVQT